MQLRLTNDELNLIANLLMEHDDKTKPRRDLLEKILAKDLRFDTEELDLLDGFLKSVQRSLRTSQEHHGDANSNPDLAMTLATLEGAVEKVDEACAMF